MEKTLRKILSLALCLILCVGLLPTASAYAEEGESEETEELIFAPQESPVQVIFSCTPEDLLLTVFDGEEPVEPEEDGSFWLLPGEYTYSAFCEGYAPAEDVRFEVLPDAEQPLEIEVTLTALERPEETEIPEEPEPTEEPEPMEEPEEDEIVLNGEAEDIIEMEPIMLMSAAPMKAAATFSVNSLSSLTCGSFISNTEHKNYIDMMMRYYIRSNDNLISALNNGKCIIFMFEGGSDNYPGTSYGTALGSTRNQAVAIVVKKNNQGNAYIAFYCEDCSSLPGNPQDTSGGSADRETTILDGVYKVSTTNHHGQYGALWVNTSTGYYTPSSNRDGWTNYADGINIHTRTDTYAGGRSWDSAWSWGCQLIGYGNDSSNAFNNFMKSVANINYNVWNSYSNKSFNTVTAGNDVGYYVLDRQLGLSGLKNLYTEKALSNITAASSTAYKNAANIYTVTLNPNGGTCSKSSITVEKGKAIGTLPTPTFEGDLSGTYVFGGWYTAATGGTRVDSSTVINNSMTIYAHWLHSGEKITFNVNGGSYSRVASNEASSYTYHDYEKGTSTNYSSYAAMVADNKYIFAGVGGYYRELPVPTKNGYYFGGWYSELSGNRVTYKSSWDGQSLSARWDAELYPTTYLTYNGHRYELYNYNMTWTQAKAACEAKGGHLVTITSAEEQAAIVKLMNDCSLGVYYIGATDAEKEGEWKWVTGEAFSYKNWDPHLPEPNGGTEENYSSIMGADNPPNKTIGEWIDSHEAEFGGFYSISNCGFICEYEFESLCEHSYNYSNASITKQPTLSSAGSMTVTCTKCGDKKQETLPALNKTDYIYGVEKSASCIAEGRDSYRLRSVTTTAITFYVTTPKVAHQYEAKTNEATCKDYGSTTYTCKVCGDSYTEYAADAWSAWSTTKPTGVDESLIQSKTQYRYADKETTTSTASSLDGWTRYDSKQVWSDYGAWSGWSTNAITASDSTQVETTTLYRYYYFYCPKCGGHEPFTGKSDCGNYTLSASDYHETWSTVAYSKSSYQKFSYTTAKYYTKSLGDGQIWCFSSGNVNATAVGTKDGDGSGGVVIKTGYRSRTRTQSTVYYYYRWKAWSDWSDTAVTASDSRKVETRTVYRYVTTKLGEHSWDGGKVTTAATCTSAGVKTYTCTVCGDTKTETVAALGHSWGAWKQTKAPTVSADGTEERACSRCGQKETRAVKAETVTVTFNPNGGAVSPASEKLLKGGRLSTLPTPTQSGYRFDGWFTAANGGSQVTTSSTFSANTTIYAHWTINATPVAGQGKITVSSASAAKGKEAVVTVSLSDNPGIVALNFKIDYDKTRLQLLGAEDDGMSGWDIGIGLGERALWDGEKNSNVNGSVLKLRFKVLDNAAAGAASVTLSDVAAMNFDEQEVAFTVESGAITVTNRIPGDVNGDGKVTITDLVRLRKYFAGYNVEIDMSASDVNGDGKVTITDLVRLRKYFAGYNVELL